MIQSPRTVGECRGVSDDAAAIMSHRDRVECVADPVGQDTAPDLRPPVTLALPRVNADDPVGDVVFSALRVAVLRIAGTDADARRGDPEGIHRLRTTTRRLRSELRSLENLVDGRWREQLEAELKWLAGRLGEVRDLDILLARLKKGAREQDRDGSSEAALAPLFATLEARREQAARSLNDALRSDRYRGLLACLERAAERPALADAASEPCRSALPAVAAAAWRRLKKQGRGLRSSDPDAEFPRVAQACQACPLHGRADRPDHGSARARAAARLHPAADPDPGYTGRAPGRGRRRW